ASWVALGAAVDGPILLRAVGEPRRLLSWAGEAQAAAERAGVALAVVAQPGHGVLQLSISEARDAGPVAEQLVRPLRGALEAEGGSLVVERAPIELKRLCDVWGDIHPDTLAIMKRIKTELDPDGVLNPGRFVGGL
ncbi:MAG: FAD-linked oxidase C-terminal domain-containing protein, partial [Candidatus Rokuibacteriota bacterium]